MEKTKIKTNDMVEETNEIKLRSEATSLFDVQRWTLDVGRSSFKPTPYGINVTWELLQNNLALIGLSPARCPIRAGAYEKKTSFKPEDDA